MFERLYLSHCGAWVLAGVALTLSLVVGPAARAAEVCDLANSHENPIANLENGCSVQVAFYRIVRPVFPLIGHVYVAALIDGQCPEGAFHKIAVYGASKGLVGPAPMPRAK